MAGKRSRSAADTRAALLAAAREEFARTGYERTTVRAVAAAAGVDPALVIRYFDSKAGLFAQAAKLELNLPPLAGLTSEQVAHALLGRFFEVWESDGTFLALLRAAATSEAAMRKMREVFAEQVAPVLATVALDRPMERAMLVGSQVLGFAFIRYVVGIPVAKSMPREQAMAWLAPTLIHYLNSPAPARER